MTKARTVLVLLFAVLLAVVAIGAMTFVAPSSHALRGLAPAFPAHPDAITDRAMGEIGAAAARGGSVGPSSRQAIARVARKAPLAPDPFLVEGTIAEMAGDSSRAERLFLAARDRSPRSEGARYFLADRYLKTNRILPGLVELAALARLSQRASQPLIPALAAYARAPGAVPQLRGFFKIAPATRDSMLALLAEDSSNAPLILSLAPEPLDGAVAADWHGRLIQSMISAGDYAGADALWKRIAGVTNRGLLFNPQFRTSSAPPPFNWMFYPGTSGLAEPSGSGGLDIIYYGRAEVTLASQLLRLAPGGYRLKMRVEGPSPAGGLSWTIHCVPSRAMLLQLPLRTVGKNPIAGPFVVPAADCPAQALELRGRPGDSAATEQLTIFDLGLDPLTVTP